MVRLLLLVLVLMVCALLLLPPAGRAQVQLTQDACLSAAVVQMPAVGPLAIDATVGGVAVLGANGKRCSALLKNVGTAAMNCAPVSLTVSATVGFPVIAGETLQLGLDGREAWKCIRVTGTNTSVAIAESLVR